MKRFPWLEFTWLILTAIALYFFKWPILVIAAIVVFFRALFWLTERFPRTMLVVLVIIRGLLGRH
jgi:hypothetical protein